MPILTEGVIYSVIREEHLLHNDFFLRCLDFVEEAPPSEIWFTCMAGERQCLQLRYGPEETAARLAHSRWEVRRYRESSLGRILGMRRPPSQPFLHEYFSFFSEKPADRLHIAARCGEKTVEADILVKAYQSPNRYRFPLRGTVVVTDTYPSINSHRWCRNSEFAFDAGRFDQSLEHSTILGEPVYAACGGVVEAVFDGLEETLPDTDLDRVERDFGEAVRIDGNHVLIRHLGGELSLCSHLQKGSILVSPGQQVRTGDLIGRVGSSGSSSLPHLHFHVMREGICGPGVPVVFDGLKTILGEDCALEDTVNLVRGT